MHPPIPMLAEAAPSADFTLQALMLATLLASIFGPLSVWVGRRDVQKREVRFEEEFASKSEMHELKGKLDALDNELRELRQSIHDNGEQRRIRIEGIIKELGDAQGEQLRKLSDMLSDLAVAQTATSATLAAWEKSPPWTPRAK